jgi:HK97 family phage portal protein
MIVTGAMTAPKAAPPERTEGVPDQGGSLYAGRVQTKAKQPVSPELSKRVSTVFRCANTISDDIATMPFQQFMRVKEGNLSVTRKISPDPVMRNLAYLLEVKPNRWMSPSIFKKTTLMWLLFWGNGLIWQPPPPALRELFILPTNVTAPKFDTEGNLWYEVRFPSGEKRMIPSVEVMHVMINSTNGIWGRGTLDYASETVGLRMSQTSTQSTIQGNGLNPAAYIQVNALLDKKGRDSYREAYTDAISGTDGAGSLAVFDNKVVKFEPITMQMKDAQFLELIGATDLEIANFFKFPAHKLNFGKQSYQSNEQQDLDYLKSCLDPNLVQWEQAARLSWLTEAEQETNYFKFIRESILRTNAKSRAELHEIQIRSGTLKPNESREIEDRDGYPEGDKFYMTKNYGSVAETQPGQPRPDAPGQGGAV